MFDEILATLSDNGKSGLAYAKVTKHVVQAMKDDPERAVAYKLLGTLAERFIESTGRLPITTVQTDKAYNQFSDAVALLSAAYTSDDHARIMDVLNQIAVASLQPLDLTSSIGS